MELNLNIEFTKDEMKDFLIDRGYIIVEHKYETVSQHYEWAGGGYHGTNLLAIKEGQKLNEFSEEKYYGLERVFHTEMNMHYSNLLKKMLLSNKTIVRDEKIDNIIN